MGYKFDRAIGIIDKHIEWHNAVKRRATDARRIEELDMIIDALNRARNGMIAGRFTI